MDEKNAIIRFELHGEKVETEIRGKLFDTVNLLLNGINSMFDTAWERELFKDAIEKLYEMWDKEPAKEEKPEEDDA